MNQKKLRQRIRANDPGLFTLGCDFYQELEDWRFEEAKETFSLIKNHTPNKTLLNFIRESVA